MNFDYKTIPSCDPQNLAAALAGGPVCIGNVVPIPGTTPNDPSIRGDMTAYGTDLRRGYDQKAVFASIDFDILPNLTISGGTRYYDYSTYETGTLMQTGTDCLNVPNGCTADSVNITSHDDNITYTGFKSRANISWRITPDMMTYFTYSEGFRPGGFNRKFNKGVATGADGIAQFLTPNAYAPDTLTNYEIGFKGQFFEHRLQVNLSAYNMDWNNVQLLEFNATVLGNTTFALNGPSYNIKGVEAQFTAIVVEGLTVTGSGSYNDAVQSNSPCLVSNNPLSGTYKSCITEAVYKGIGLAPLLNPFGAKGSVPPFSPKFQGNIRARYEWNAGGDYRAHVSLSGNYVSSMWSQPSTYTNGEGILIPNTTLLRYLQPAYGTIDASIGVAKDKWYAEVYATNLNNSNASVFTSSAQFIKSEVPIRPRVIMLKVGASF
jgi:outer membrane receptor protein involved in Fe transport